MTSLLFTTKRKTPMRKQPVWYRDSAKMRCVGYAYILLPSSRFLALFLFIVALAGMPYLHQVASAEINSHFVRNVSQNKSVIIFVHGVIGDAVSTWSNGNHYWPEMLTHDQAFDGQNIYVYQYPSPTFGKSFSIDELAENMRLVLATDGVLEHQSITFVAHSMGGLVTRAFILKYRDVVPKIRFLYFFATPTTGSPYGKLAKLVSNNPQLHQLYPMDADSYLGPLQNEWLDANLHLKSYCAYETLPTYKVATIVERQSATNLCNQRLDPIDADHINIVKPTGSASTSYRALKAAMQETKTPEKPLANPGSTRTRGSVIRNDAITRDKAKGNSTATGQQSGAEPNGNHYKGSRWQATGDYLIDDVQSHLNELDARQTYTDAELANTLRPLFNQPVFFYIGEELPEPALYRFCRTSHLLAFYTNHFGELRIRTIALHVTQKLILLQDLVSEIYGPAFSGQDHCTAYVDNKQQFISHMPARMRDRSEIKLRVGEVLSDIRTSLSSVGLMDSATQATQSEQVTVAHQNSSQAPATPAQNSSPGTHNLRTGPTIMVRDSSGKPVNGIEVLVVNKDHTHLTREVSDKNGTVQLEEKPSDAVILYAAGRGFYPYYQPGTTLVDGFTVQMQTYPNGGSVIIPDGTGYVPGLDGRLNPILDDLNRTYIYADNVAIEGGKAQPVPFAVNKPFLVNDRHGNAFYLSVIAIVGSSSLIDYTRIEPAK